MILMDVDRLMKQLEVIAKCRPELIYIESASNQTKPICS